MSFEFWILAAVVLAVLEIASVVFFPIFFAISALGAMVCSIAGAPDGVQWAVFIVGGLALSAFLRPIAKRQLIDGPSRKSNVESLVGQRFVVETAVDGRASTGTVSVRGQSWSARPVADELSQIPVGAEVLVVEVHGATLLVSPVPASAVPSQES
jgi:membrane protein implicated in regulation of membrane protease activity